MADILTHVLVAYIAAKLLSARYGWITRPYLTAAMIGGIIPDLDKLDLLIPAESIEDTASVPFAGDGLHRLGGVAISTAIIGYLVPSSIRGRVVAMVVLGAGLHLIADTCTGSGIGPSYDLLWPLTAIEPIVPRVYHSSDTRVTATVMALAALTWLVVESYTADERSTTASHSDAVEPDIPRS